MARKRNTPSFSERAMGLQAKGSKVSAQALDFFANTLARTGYGSPNLTESAEYPLVRFTFNYWNLLSLYEGSWIARRIIDVPAQDMVRAWPRLTSDVDPKDLTKIDRALRRTNAKNNLLTAMVWGRLFGGAGALIVIKGQENELDEPLDLDKVPLGGFLGLIPFDRWSGIYPSTDWCTDIKRPVDFNLPESYRVQGTGGQSFEVHASRILRFTGPTVPTPEREAYSMWGISVLEPVFQELQKRDNVSWNIVNLTFRANILGMKFPDLAALLSGLGGSANFDQKFQERMQAVNHLISNQSLVPLPENGSIEATSYSFAGLGEVMTQTCLDISGAAQIPVARLWGRTITGLGQTGDGDERIYEERIGTDQDTHLRPQLEKLYPVLCASELGEVPDDLDLNFPSIRVLDEKEKSELAKGTTDTVIVALNGGLISPRAAAMELKQSSDVTGVFTNITDEALEKLSDEVQAEGELGEGLFGEAGGGLNEASSPAKALKIENRAGKEPSVAHDPKAAADRLREIVERSKARDSDGAQQATHFIHGLTIHVETPKGFTRHGKGWRTIMPADYGYVDGQPGADGDSLDAYVGPDVDDEDGWIYVVDQKHLPPKKGFDESKCMIGFKSQGDALRAYRAGHHRAKDVYLDFVPMSPADFKEWLATRDPRRPACEHRAVLA